MSVTEYERIRPAFLTQPQFVWLVLRKDDPFVAGGAAEAAFDNAQSMWTYLAERVAEDGYARWQREKARGSRMSHADAQLHEAAGYEVDALVLRHE